MWNLHLLRVISQIYILSLRSPDGFCDMQKWCRSFPGNQIFLCHDPPIPLWQVCWKANVDVPVPRDNKVVICMDSLIFVYPPMSFWKVFLLSMLVKMITVWSAGERQVPFTDVKILTTRSVTSVHITDIHTGPLAPCYEAFTSRVIDMLRTGTGYASIYINVMIGGAEPE